MAEAEAEGPDAVAELRLLADRCRLAAGLISRRRSLHMTQHQLAAAGSRQSEISRIEGGRGNPMLKTIGALARALGAELRLTVSRDDPTSPPLRGRVRDLHPGLASADRQHASA